MKATYRSRFAKLAAGVLAALGMSSAVLAQEPLEQRLQRLEKQNEEIRKNAETLQKQNENKEGRSPDRSGGWEAAAP